MHDDDPELDPIWPCIDLFNERNSMADPSWNGSLVQVSYVCVAGKSLSVALKSRV